MNERIKDHIKNCTVTYLTNNLDQEAFDMLKSEYCILRDLKDLSNFIQKKFPSDIKNKKQYNLGNAYSKSFKRINEFIETYKNSNLDNKNVNIKELKDKILDSFCFLLEYYDLIRREIN